MGLTLTDDGPKRGKDWRPVPEGGHPARCVLLADLGTQSGEFGPKHQVFIQWEFPKHEVEVDGEKRPMVLGKRFTMSMFEKSNLYKLLKSWRGRDFTPEEKRGFSLKKVLGAPCYIQVTHTVKDGKTYANIDSVIKLPDGLAVGEQVHPSVYFELEMGEDSEAFKALSKGIQRVIFGCEEWSGQSGDVPDEEPPPHHDDDAPEGDDDIPF